MKPILLASVFAASCAASATPQAIALTSAARAPVADTLAELSRAEVLAFGELMAARAQVALARARWDGAVAAGKVNEAGVWARRHAEAMQVRKAALTRWATVIGLVDAARYASG